MYFFPRVPRSRTTGPYGSSIFNFSKNLHTVFHNGHPNLHPISSVFSSVAQLCPSLCDPMNRSTPGLPVHHQLQEFTQTHVHRVGEAIQPFHPLSSPSPPAPNPSQHQSFPMSQLFTCGGQSTIVCKRSLFSTPSPTLTFYLFDNSHSDRGEAVSHDRFDLHFPHDY